MNGLVTTGERIGPGDILRIGSWEVRIALPESGAPIDVADEAREQQAHDAVGGEEGGLDAVQPLAGHQAVLDDGGPSGPLKRALEKLEGADVLLRRAENLLAQRERKGIKVAGPAESALGEFRHAQSLRVRLDRRIVRHRDLIFALGRSDVVSTPLLGEASQQRFEDARRRGWE